MKKLLKYSLLSFMVLVIITLTVSFRAEAFSIGFNPFAFLQKTADIIVSRASDIIYYLIMQKKYIFDGYVDPNSYVSQPIPSEIGVDFPATSTPNTANSVSIASTSNRTVLVPVTTVPAVRTVVINPPILPPAPITNSILSNNSSSGSNPLILNYTNIERRKKSLEDLRGNSLLDAIASLRADDLFQNQYFEHESPDGKSASELAKTLGYEYLLIGENLALGNYDSDQSIIDAWMASTGHRANILNDKYTELGVVVKEGVYDGNETTIAVQIFALPLATCPKPNQNTKAFIDSSSITIKQMQDQATVLFSNLNAIKNNQEIGRTFYNQKVQEYNYFARRVNEAVVTLKGIIDSYNFTVTNYNTCINNI